MVVEIFKSLRVAKVAGFVDVKPCIKAMLPELGDLEPLSYLLLESALASQPKYSSREF